MRTLPLGGSSGIPVSALCLGAMMFGTTVDEPTSIAILDAFVAADGTFVDTSNNYPCWLPGATGDESENLLGSWLKRRGIRDEMVIATKVGARPDRRRGPDWPVNAEGLSAAAIQAGVAGSLRRLGTDRLDVYYAHIQDRMVNLHQTVEAFGELVADGSIAVAGCSNHPTPRIRRARAIATEHGWAPFNAVQQRHTYLRPGPTADFAVQEVADHDLLSDTAGSNDLTLLAYSTLLSGAYTRADRPLPPEYQTAANAARLEVLREVAAHCRASLNQVVLAWLLTRDQPIIPILGVSSVAQLTECLGALEVKLDASQRDRLDAAWSAPA